MNKLGSLLKKHRNDLLFVGLIILLLSPVGLPVRAFLIKGLSLVTTEVLPLEIDEEERKVVASYNWLLSDESGNTVNLSRFEEEVLFVNYWATWCPPCIAEMPSMQSLFDQYGDRVVFLFIANDDQDKVVQFMEDKGYTFPIYFMSQAPPEEMNSSSLPTTYIINQQGEIVVEKVGAANWNSQRIHGLLDDLIQ